MPETLSHHSIEVLDPIQEECGLVAAYFFSPESKLTRTMTALTGVQHRGQHGAGIAMLTAEGHQVIKRPGLIRDAFTPAEIHSLDQPSRYHILHCRYGTNGNWHESNVQPIVQHTPQGDTLIIAHNGQFEIQASSLEEFEEHIPDGASDTYLFSLRLKNSPGIDWDEKVLTTLDRSRGAYSLAIGINDDLYLVRDPQGVRPLVIAQTPEGIYAASETHALDKIGLSVEREILPGEVIKINQNGINILRPGSTIGVYGCDFEWAYFSRPDSSMPPQTGEDPEQWMSMNRFRMKCGEILATEAPIPHATMVIGIPDSGTPVGAGYAAASNLPFQPYIIRDHHDQNGNLRLFMQDNQIDAMQQSVLGKLSLIPDQAIWQDAIVVLADDSIVRGTVSYKITQAVRAMGAKEVHWVVGFPPVSHPCHKGVSMRTYEELIAARHQADPEKIAQEIGADSVHYISYRGFLEARLGDRVRPTQDNNEMFSANGGCGECVTGLSPITKSGVIYDLGKEVD